MTLTRKLSWDVEPPTNVSTQHRSSTTRDRHYDYSEDEFGTPMYQPSSASTQEGSRYQTARKQLDTSHPTLYEDRRKNEPFSALAGENRVSEVDVDESSNDENGQLWTQPSRTSKRPGSSATEKQRSEKTNREPSTRSRSHITFTKSRGEIISNSDSEFVVKQRDMHQTILYLAEKIASLLTSYIYHREKSRHKHTLAT